MSEYSEFLSTLEHPRREEIRKLAKLIERNFPKLNNGIQWNAPSYVLDEKSVVTFRIFPAPNFQVILHCGAKKLPPGTDLKIDIGELQHKWPDNTRCQIKVGSATDFPGIVKAITKWISKINDVNMGKSHD